MAQAEPTAVFVGGQNTPEELFKGRIVVTKTRFPNRFPSREAFVKAIEESRTNEVSATVDDPAHGWDIEYIALFEAPLTSDVIAVNFSSVPGDRTRFISAGNQYSETGSRIFTSSVHLSRSEFEPGKSYLMTIQVNQSVIASTTIWLVDRPTALRETAR